LPVLSGDEKFQANRLKKIKIPPKDDDDDYDSRVIKKKKKS
jgi:hypothetical protein